MQGRSGRACFLFVRASLFSGAVAVASIASCANPPSGTAVPEDTIDIAHELPLGFSFGSGIRQLSLILDEVDGGASLYATRFAQTAGVTGDGRAFTLAVDDYDGDGRYEAKLAFRNLSTKMRHA